MKFELPVVAIYALGVFIGGLAVWVESVILSGLILLIGAAIAVAISLRESRGGRHGRRQVRNIQDTPSIK